MAFTRNTLIRIGGPSNAAPALWVYATADTQATLNTADYFLLANDLLKVNDLIFGVTETAGTPVHATYIVNAVSATTVDVTNGVVITATDSD